MSAGKHGLMIAPSCALQALILLILVIESIILISQTQAEFLRARRCEEAQGFLFARPMPADDLAAKLSKLHANRIHDHG